MLSYVLVGCLFLVFSSVVHCEKNKGIAVTFANCTEDSVIRFNEGFSMHVDGQFKAKIKGCITADSFEDATVTIKIKNYGFAPWDMCNNSDKKGPQMEIVKMLHDALQLNFECPFKEVDNCIDSIVDMRKYKRYLKLLPKFNSMKLNFQHDNERTSCVEIRTKPEKQEENQNNEN